MKELLARLNKALGEMADLDAAPDTATEAEMTAEQFIAYATEQVEKAAADTDPGIRKARLAHLRTQVEAVAKAFDPGASTGSFAGDTKLAFPVTQFRDPAQVPDLPPKTVAPGQTPAVTNFGDQGVPPNARGVGAQPPGGQNPPLTAGKGGAGYSAAFTKMVEGLSSAIEKLTTDPAETSETSETQTVEKSTKVLWPADMNSAFGSGLLDAEEEPTWGRDPKPAAG